MQKPGLGPEAQKRRVMFGKVEVCHTGLRLSSDKSSSHHSFPFYAPGKPVTISLELQRLQFAFNIFGTIFHATFERNPPLIQSTAAFTVGGKQQRLLCELKS